VTDGSRSSSFILWSHRWTRRAWLTTTATQTGALLTFAYEPWRVRRSAAPGTADRGRRTTGGPLCAGSAERLPPAALLPLAQQGVEAAQSAGAQYAETRLTRVVNIKYKFPDGGVQYDREFVGLGVRALVKGYWGFASCPLWAWAPDTVAQLARAAVAQATVNAKGPPRTVEMGVSPPRRGTGRRRSGSTPLRSRSRRKEI